VRNPSAITGFLRLANWLTLLGTVVAVLLSAALAESANSVSAKPVEIDIPIQSQAYGVAFFEETARMFEKLRPDVRVNLTGSARVHEKLRIRIMADDLPDATDADLLYGTLITAGRIRDLSPYLDGPDWDGQGIWRSRFLPGVLERWDRGGRVYSVPFAHAVWAIFYNQKLFAEHGWAMPRTWDDFFNLCEKIRAAGVAPLSLPGVYLRYGDAFLRSAYFNLVGPDGYRAYNQLAPGTRSDPRFVRAAAVLQRVSANCMLKGWEGMSHTGAEQAFLDGKCAMTVAGSWLGSEVRGKIPAGFSIGAMNFPVFPDGITDPDTLQVQSSYYFLFTKADPVREQATVDFFRFLTSRERARAFAHQQDATSAVTGIRADDYSDAMRDVAALIAKAPASFDGGRPTSSAFLALMEQSMNDLRQQLMTGRITPQEFADRLEAAAQAERVRAENPTSVKVKHRWKTALLLLALALSIGLLGWETARRSRARRKAGSSTSRAEGHLGKLRLPMAAGFVGPALILFGLLVVLPGLQALLWAFTRWDGIGGARVSVGIFNFKWLLLESDTFWYALRNNLYIMVVPTLVVVPLSLLLAACIHRGVWGGNFFKAVFLFPNLLGGIAATLLWMNAYDPHGGLVNTALVKLGGVLHNGWLSSFAGYPWLSQDNLYRALIPIYVWMACGFNLVLYLAAMQGIDPELYEAAEIEGASAGRQFFTITLPLIWDVLAISAVFIVVAGLNTFEMIWLLTSQDPTSQSHVLSTLMVSTMFKEFEVGRATAIALIMFVLVLIGSALVLRVMRQRDTVRD
jgi:raffinose/stachyose/melibiose transport system permease protein